MLEPNKNDSKTVPTSSKPVEIDLFENKSQIHLRKDELSVAFVSNNINEISSYSAYASAESSPNQNSLLVGTETASQLRSSSRQLRSDLLSAKSSSSSLDSYLTIDNSRVMEENGKETPTNNNRSDRKQQDNTPTESFYEINSMDQMNKNYLEDEFQSLPCHFPEDVLKRLPKSSDGGETINSVISREIESQLSKLDLLATAENPNDINASPSHQPKSFKNTLGSFIGKVFFGGSSEKEAQKSMCQSGQSLKLNNEMNKSKSTGCTSLTAPNHELNTAAKLTTANSITSASSPNPDCSPYKLLEISLPGVAKNNVVVNDLNSRVSKGSFSSEKKPDAIKSIKPMNSLIESLASLNHKESDKIDPILSSASKKNSGIINSITTAAATNTADVLQEKKCDADKTKRLNENITSSSSSNKNTSQNSQTVDNVPATSRQFCMDLNFNLAAAAAATAAGPVVVVSAPENRFTSNASTNSIHNDLKMILEECKEQSSHRGIIDSAKKTSKSQQQQSSKSQEEKTKTSSIKKTACDSADTDNLNLIKTMLSMVNRNKISDSKQSVVEQSTGNWSLKQSGRYRYSKEFLNQINEQRSEFIKEIYPEIFKAYCYCTNGKYWDPEKYFDIIQFPGEFDKIASNRSNNNNTRNSLSYYNNNSYSKNNYIYNNNNNNSSQKYNQNRKRNNSTSNSSKYDSFQKPKYQTDIMDTPLFGSSSSNNIESPRPLQVPKNSPKIQQEQLQIIKNTLNSSANNQKASKENKKLANLFENFSSLGGVEHTKNNINQADKILLDLIKNKESSSSASSNLLDILNSNNKKDSFNKPTNDNNKNILDSLFAGPKSPQIHFPMVLTAQELEMSQMLTQQNHSSKQNKLPYKHQNLIDFNAESAGNTSVAYKTLVQNLINHPLNSSSSVIGHQPQLQQQQSKQSQWPTSADNGTNVLRQMLNLNLNDSSIIQVSEPIKREKRSKKKSHHKPKSPSSSMLDASENKFPTVNPHEKPFENNLNDDLSKDKHTEILVASTVNHVLNKSPTTNNKNILENLFDKMNQHEQPIKSHSKKKTNKHENEHFNLLLNKMMHIIDTNNESKPTPSVIF